MSDGEVLELFEGVRKAPRRSPEIEARVIELVAEHGSLATAAKQVGILSSTARKWERRHPDFSRAVNMARMEALENHAEEIIGIADNVAGCDSVAVVNAARLQIDARKWVLSKLAPHKYGDQLQLTGAGGKDLIPAMSPEAAVPRLMQVLAILLPAQSNSELHVLAHEMAAKLALPMPAPEEDAGT